MAEGNLGELYFTIRGRNELRDDIRRARDEAERELSRPIRSNSGPAAGGLSAAGLRYQVAEARLRAGETGAVGVLSDALLTTPMGNQWFNIAAQKANSEARIAEFGNAAYSPADRAARRAYASRGRMEALDRFRGGSSGIGPDYGGVVDRFSPQDKRLESQIGDLFSSIQRQASTEAKSARQREILGNRADSVEFGLYRARRSAGDRADSVEFGLYTSQQRQEETVSRERFKTRLQTRDRAARIAAIDEEILRAERRQDSVYGARLETMRAKEAVARGGSGGSGGGGSLWTRPLIPRMVGFQLMFGGFEAASAYSRVNDAIEGSAYAQPMDQMKGVSSAIRSTYSGFGMGGMARIAADRLGLVKWWTGGKYSTTADAFDEAAKLENDEKRDSERRLRREKASKALDEIIQNSTAAASNISYGNSLLGRERAAEFAYKAQVKQINSEYEASRGGGPTEERQARQRRSAALLMAGEVRSRTYDETSQELRRSVYGVAMGMPAIQARKSLQFGLAGEYDFRAGMWGDMDSADPRLRPALYQRNAAMMDARNAMNAEMIRRYRSDTAVERLQLSRASWAASWESIGEEERRALQQALPGQEKDINDRYGLRREKLLRDFGESREDLRDQLEVQRAGLRGSFLATNAFTSRALETALTAKRRYERADVADKADMATMGQNELKLMQRSLQRELFMAGKALEINPSNTAFGAPNMADTTLQDMLAALQEIVKGINNMSFFAQ